MSPSIKGTLDQLQSIIDRINNVNLNSCDLAQGLVGGGLAMAGKTEAYCKTTANSQGWATDYARASAECKTGGKSADHIKSANNVHGDQRPVDDAAVAGRRHAGFIEEHNFDEAEVIKRRNHRGDEDGSHLGTRARAQGPDAEPEVRHRDR